ncbi:hypothetical protein, partial [Nocardiopsis listeri]|uniref:hypothetical protein n=1 Tax=Nocardiopsis listeri TaxID=53440 RepID=UPI001CC1DD27
PAQQPQEPPPEAPHQPTPTPPPLSRWNARVAGEEVDTVRQGVASATVSTAQQLGGAVGLAALVAA